MYKPKALIIDNVDDCDGAGLVFFPSKQSDQGPNEPHRPTEHGAPNAGSANFFAQSSVSLSAIVGILGLVRAITCSQSYINIGYEENDV